MLKNIFAISLSMSAVILLLLIVSPLLNKRYSAKWRYFIWLIIAIRLIIPVRIELPEAPVNISVPNQTVVFRQEGVPIMVTDDSYTHKANTSPVSADYAPVITLQELLAVVWGTGAVGFFLYHIINYIIFKKKIKPYCKKVNIEVLDDVLKDMKLKVKPQLIECSKIASPMMIGFLKPMILLPDNDYSNNELYVVLKHELTHIRRGDIWYKLLLIAANSIHWFNPLVYLMVKPANRDLEYSCDDVVVKNSDMNFRKEYSLTILKAMQKSGKDMLSAYLNGGVSNE
ncbi:MAG TPA: M56 family metallopeptidase [Acetivibrio sp.]|nr:M56 family metallopeptidase [Acetivibrio sp.]